MFTMGSLFDGIGGFPLAAIHNGIVPLWASEIESFPIQVTKIRFSQMFHAGDITKLDGNKLPVVDIICGGSPCQDLSFAGKRAGLEGERSGLFMEQIRITKEMRCADGKHYYDEIGLLNPTEKSDAGYRLYDEKALETLQQILFFREFDIPLKQIRTVMYNPSLDRNKILQMQRKMLVAKKERMECLIASIDDILKGENKMDFAIFTKTEIEELCQTTLEHMPDNMKESVIQEFSGIEQWQKHYVERCSKKDMQRGYQKMIEWYGDTKLEELQKELLQRANGKVEYDNIADEINRLRELKQNTLAQSAQREDLKQRTAEMKEFLEWETGVVKEYDGQLVRRLVEKVAVEFKSGMRVNVK